ncbi:MGMT family protein [Leadbettera azotonutricia]|uniref:Methylated-DNA--[protein]-cysteine S-methyltransferase n=1 Tax=Leadbettera azotonutricia (strain ATCC BAA-888 / DSM 13862 / ZAS-9) TaxID=545695 RepID=F5Y8S7_LEAAZ|nr:MGMT family protein [Leadbettera azotonutricia]AEF82810.1 methylated-DNA--[protein]-cysteine S-methyltransferase [Leadbettera azotonutricia ZAS-9]
MTESTRRIIEAIRAVPAGKVSCYRDVGIAAGLRNGARQVVRILHSMSESQHLPWQRIIRADGFIALESCAGREEQTALLRSEGVAVSKAGKVDMEKFGVKPA